MCVVYNLPQAPAPLAPSTSEAAPLLESTSPPTLRLPRLQLCTSTPSPACPSMPTRAWRSCGRRTTRWAAVRGAGCGRARVHDASVHAWQVGPQQGHSRATAGAALQPRAALRAAAVLALRHPSQDGCKGNTGSASPAGGAFGATGFGAGAASSPFGAPGSSPAFGAASSPAFGASAPTFGAASAPGGWYKGGTRVAGWACPPTSWPLATHAGLGRHPRSSPVPAPCSSLWGIRCGLALAIWAICPGLWSQQRSCLW